MKNIILPLNERVILGADALDDAGVYRLADHIAIIQTLDFFTPIVDDPFVYGQVAACNALSDVYAKGGKPVTAMNIVCFPVKKFSIDILNKILDGGIDILNRAGVALLGGHSVTDDEMKYGLSVTGIIDPDKVIRNRGLREGDVIVLTKPLGTGIISTALKAGELKEEWQESFIKSMTVLNDKASCVMMNYDVHACTDVTGFGLAGHLQEMISEDSLEVVIRSADLPLLPGALENAAQGMIPGGLYKNRDYIGALWIVERSVQKERAEIVFDPQTSGGLLIAVPEKEGAGLVNELRSGGVRDAAVIADVKNSLNPMIRIL